MTIAVLQISDCHLVGQGQKLIGVDTQASLQAVLEQALTQHTPDAIIASGDLAHEPTREVYTRFLTTLRAHTQAPLLCLPGNHDVLGVMQSAQLPMAPVELGSWSLVGLDSHEDDAPRALIEAPDLSVVQAALENAVGEHCLVATHHPLVAVNCPWLDVDRIQNPVDLIEWLRRCSAKDGDSRLRSVVFGHAHQIVEDTCGGVPVYGVPSTCFQFKPGSQSFTLDTTSPGYRWLFLGDDGQIETQVHRVASFPIHVQLNT